VLIPAALIGQSLEAPGLLGDTYFKAYGEMSTDAP
jgi:hypothetical protein